MRRNQLDLQLVSWAYNMEMRRLSTEFTEGKKELTRSLTGKDTKHIINPIMQGTLEIKLTDR